MFLPLPNLKDKVGTRIENMGILLYALSSLDFDHTLSSDT